MFNFPVLRYVTFKFENLFGRVRDIPEYIFVTLKGILLEGTHEHTDFLRKLFQIDLNHFCYNISMNIFEQLKDLSISSVEIHFAVFEIICTNQNQY